MVRNLNVNFLYIKFEKKDEAICQVLINFISDEKTRTSIPKNSKKHVMTDEIVDFKDDLIKIDSLDSSKGILNLFISINGEKVQSYEENVPNFYKIILKDYEVKDKFVDLNFNIVDIEVNMSIKVRNILSGGEFASRLNMFKRKSEMISGSSGIISTGVSMKDRLKLFNKGLQQPAPKPQNKIIPNKLKISEEFNKQLMKNQNENSRRESLKLVQNKNNNIVKGKGNEEKNKIQDQENKNEKDKDNKGKNSIKNEKVEEPKKQDENKNVEIKKEEENNEKKKEKIIDKVKK
jgi:hypothetical protein